LFGFPKSNIDKVDATMNAINDQREVANDISEAISNTANLGLEIDEVRGRPSPGFWWDGACLTTGTLG
jgi:hypothetical protein